jgi:hypothetical protein
MDYALYSIAAIGLAAGAFLVARSPSFWIDFGKELFSRLWPLLVDYIMNNRPKSPEEWEEWRELSSMKPKEMSAKQRARYEELKKLNAEYRKNN